MGRTLIGERVTGVRVTPISGPFEPGADDGSETGGGGGDSEDALVVAAGDVEGTVRLADGLGAMGEGEDEVDGAAGSTSPGPSESRETSSTAATTMATTARPMAPRANIAGPVRYHGAGAGLISRLVRANTGRSSYSSRSSHA